MAKGYSTAHDLSGLKFGRFTVTDKHEIRGRRRSYWLCICECGTTKWVMAQALKSGGTKSCGCLNDESRKASATHGATRGGKHSLEYTSWHSMKQRCTNQKNTKFSRYGARGIDICPQWIDNFDQFLCDMGPRPSPKHTLERKDNNRGYSPDNCEWATKAKQNRNHSRNRFYTFQGETLCIEDWCKRTGIPHATLHWRIANWPLERALTQPLSVQVFSPVR